MSDSVRGIEKKNIIKNSGVGAKNERRKDDPIQNTSAYGRKITKDQ